MNYKDIMSKFYKDYLNKDNYAFQLSFFITREKILEDLFNLHKVFKFANTDFTPDGLNATDYQNMAVIVKGVINNVLSATSVEECIKALSVLEKEVFNFINNKLIISTRASNILLRFGYQTFDVFPHYAFTKIFEDIKSSKKRINMLWYNYYNTFPDKEYLKSHWQDAHNNIELKTYGYFKRHSSVSRTEQQILATITEKYLLDSTQVHRVDTNFDIGFLDYANKNVEEHFDTCVKQPFYYVNSHVKKYAPIIIGINEYCLTYETISFISKYLTNVSVYKEEDSEYVLIIGLATKSRTSDSEVIHDIISQLVGIKTPNFIYDIFGEDREDIIFRSAYIDPEYIQTNLLKNKDQIDKLVAEQNKLLDNQTCEDTRRPLIPFSPGQLGLVLVSGDIDGIIDEGNGCYHVIRGSTYRTPTVVNEENNNVRTRTVTNNVATSVTVMLANGQEITLR